MGHSARVSSVVMMMERQQTSVAGSFGGTMAFNQLLDGAVINQHVCEVMTDEREDFLAFRSWLHPRAKTLVA